jgi:CTP synthase (UTP-ammonia lyase)
MVILNDLSTTVRRALEEIDPNYESYNGLVVCGTHNFHDVEMMIGEIKKARESGTPALLICAGHQLAWIEYCRSKQCIASKCSNITIIYLSEYRKFVERKVFKRIGRTKKGRKKNKTNEII